MQIFAPFHQQFPFLRKYLFHISEDKAIGFLLNFYNLILQVRKFSQIAFFLSHKQNIHKPHCQHMVWFRFFLWSPLNKDWLSSCGTAQLSPFRYAANHFIHYRNIFNPSLFSLLAVASYFVGGGVASLIGREQKWLFGRFQLIAISSVLSGKCSGKGKTFLLSKSSN